MAWPRSRFAVSTLPLTLLLSLSSFLLLPVKHRCWFGLSPVRGHFLLAAIALQATAFNNHTRPKADLKAPIAVTTVRRRILSLFSFSVVVGGPRRHADLSERRRESAASSESAFKTLF
jgi:hypothetical protein